jgi:hypothetical protein
LGLALLVARRDGTNARLTFEPGADPRNVEKIRRGSAWLLQRHLEGRLAMHGAAVAKDGKAVVILGRSGAGKSTLAAAMCLCGGELLADDAVAIDPGPTPGSWLVVPGEVDHWLDPAALEAIGERATGGSKEPVRTWKPADAPATLVAFVELGFCAGEPVLRPQHGIHAVASLVPQLARFVIDEPDRQRRELDLLHQIVDDVASFRLDRPRRFDRLDASAELVLDLLGQGRARV